MRVSTAYLAWQFAMFVGSRMDDELGPLGLSKAQFNALQHVADSPGITSAEAARRTGITAQSMGAAIADLVKRGALSREPYPLHGRVLALSITESGRRLLDDAVQAVGRVNEEALAVLEERDRDRLHETLLSLVLEVRPEVVVDSKRVPS